MEFFETVKKRHSYRGEFLPVPIPEDDLKAILDAGIRAPSGYNTQTTSYIVVQNPRLRSQLADMWPTPAMRTAPVIIVPVSEHVVTQKGLVFEIEDYGASVENLLLAITAKGYAGVWMDGAVKLEDMGKPVAELLGVPAGKTVRAVIPMGVPAQQWEQKEKKPLGERVRFLL